MPNSGRYLVGQKLSDYKFEKLIRAFAHGELPSDVAKENRRRKGGRAPNTVFGVYELIRSRLVEIGYFPEPAAYWRSMQQDDARHQFPFSETALRLVRQADRLRGTTMETARLTLAELIFRAENPRLQPEALYLEIRTALRMTGPLNRPPRNMDLWDERHRIDMLRRSMAEHRARNKPEIYDPLIASEERLIVQAEQELQRKMRQRQRAKSSPVTPT